MTPNGSAFSGVRRTGTAAGTPQVPLSIPRSEMALRKHVRRNALLGSSLGDSKHEARQDAKDAYPQHCERP